MRCWIIEVLGDSDTTLLRFHCTKMFYYPLLAGQFLVKKDGGRNGVWLCETTVTVAVWTLLGFPASLPQQNNKHKLFQEKCCHSNKNVNTDIKRAANTSWVIKFDKL